MPVSRTVVINFILVVLGIFCLIRFVSEWGAIHKFACGDIRYHLHSSRRLMAGYDPNWYLTPLFENSEFQGALTARGLRKAIEKDGVVVGKDKSDIRALNLILKRKNLINQLSTPSNPAPVLLNTYIDPATGDVVRMRRLFLEKTFSLQCPSLATKDDLSLNHHPVFTSSPSQSATPFYLIAFYPLYRLPFEYVKVLWFLMSWGLALLSVLMMASQARWRDGPQMVWVIALSFMALSYSFDVHIIRGQKYILYLFLLSLSYYLWDRKKFFLFSGFLMGCLMMFRPNLIILIFSLALSKKLNFLVGVALAVIVGVSLPMIIQAPEAWRSYLSQNTSVHLPINPSSIKRDAFKYGNSFYDGAANDVQQSFKLKDPEPHDVWLSFTSVKGCFHRFITSSPFLSNLKNTGLIFILILIALVIIKRLIVYEPFFYWQGGDNSSDAVYWIIGTALFLMTNYLSKINYIYTEVLWIFPLSLMIIYAQSMDLFLKRFALPIMVFVFFSSFGIEWFSVPGIAVLLADLMMLFILSGF